MISSHNAHTLRAHKGEWCGGTEPPTIVTIDQDNLEITVDVFAPGSKLHVGEVLQPTGRERFILGDGPYGPREIGDYALRGLQSLEES